MKYINKTIELFNTNPAAFLITLIGTCAQTIHTTKLAFDISPLTDYWIAIESALLGVFFSIGLIFFTIRAGYITLYDFDSEKQRLNKLAEIADYYKTAKAFMVFECFINTFYWIGAIIFIPYFKDKELNLSIISSFSWFKFVSGIIYSIALPVILRKYAGEIKGEAKKDEYLIAVSKVEENLKKEIEANKKDTFNININGTIYTGKLG
jgi:hypothetical protein